MTLNAENTADTLPKGLSDKVLHAIQGALREEKEPKWKRFLKITIATAICSGILGAPFLLAFNTQLTISWIVALVFWIVCFLVGFSLYFHPQPRLVVPGYWSPLVLSRLLVVSTMAVLAQILLCPSFVFLKSPLPWNPLEPVTVWLMQQRGMPACMSFCGFFFAFVSGIAGIGSVYKVVPERILRSVLVLGGVLLVCQIPLIWVQWVSENLRAFLPYFLTGSIAGCLGAFLTVFTAKMIVLSLRREKSF